MIKTSEFLKIVLKDILHLPLVGKIYKDYGVSPHIFSTYKDNNRLGKVAADVLNKVIFDEIEKNKYKEVALVSFMKGFLSEKEILQFTDIKDIVPIAISKFMTRRSESKLTDFRVVDLLDRGWTVKDYILGCFRLWENIIEEDVPNEHGGTVNQWVKIVSARPDTEYALLNECNDFVGFWYFKALFDEAYSKMKAGKFLTSELSLDLIPAMLPGTYNIFVGVCLKENYRHTLAMQKLIFSMLKAFENFALDAIYINEICAWAYTDDGISLCKTIGLKYVTEHIEHGKIYCGTIYDLLDKPICNSFTVLRNLYTNRVVQQF